ncbi:hypothetical protein BDA99DRAFT_558301 [Phascolomyces articulosus]|uniref:Inner centromere protein ARK-binding domain-containing protein n=1 Tax=Phascolomyces articulosus TaxID=60185 RepID=A0AAD5KD19_9FUNG|nr:hypothetical protein BDA99DRAFT_558301 [Phascolomyces articulosus]
MPSDLEEETRKKGNLWAHEQQAKLKQSAREKLHHLEKITNDHLTWFDQHDTIEKLIQSKRPLDATTTASIPPTKRVSNHKNNNAPSPVHTTDRPSMSSHASMKTANEMNEEMEDQVQLVQSQRHHIPRSNNSSTIRHSGSFHRSSNNNFLTQQQQPQHWSTISQNNNKKSSRNSKAKTSSKEEGEEHDSDSDGMDPDLYPTKVPEWAMSPELMEKLKLQKPTDGDKIFGEMIPMEMSVIFGTRKRTQAK